MLNILTKFSAADISCASFYTLPWLDFKNVFYFWCVMKFHLDFAEFMKKGLTDTVQAKEVNRSTCLVFKYYYDLLCIIIIMF